MFRATGYQVRPRPKPRGRDFLARWLVLGLLSSNVSAAGQDQELNAALIGAAVEGRTDQVAALLDRGASVLVRDPDGLNPLMYAAMGGNEQTVRLLLARGSELEARTRDGATALMIGSGSGHMGLRFAPCWRRGRTYGPPTPADIRPWSGEYWEGAWRWSGHCWRPGPDPTRETRRAGPS